MPAARPESSVAAGIAFPNYAMSKSGAARSKSHRQSPGLTGLVGDHHGMAVRRRRSGCLSHRVSCGHPGFQAARQGVYAFEAAIHQNLGDARRRGFAGTSAIKNDVSISGKILEVRIDILQGDGHGTRNPMRLQFARGRGTYIDNERTRATLDELVELGDADACHAQHLVEAAPLPP